MGFGLLAAVLFLAVGYAAISNIDFAITGTASAEVDTGLFEVAFDKNEEIALVDDFDNPKNYPYYTWQIELYLEKLNAVAKNVSEIDENEGHNWIRRADDICPSWNRPSRPRAGRRDAFRVHGGACGGAAVRFASTRAAPAPNSAARTSPARW